jgi:hypothetical protein
MLRALSMFSRHAESKRGLPWREAPGNTTIEPTIGGRGTATKISGKLLATILALVMGPSP